MSHVLFPQRAEIATRRIDATLTPSQDEKQKEEGTRVESDWDEGCDQVGGRVGRVGVGASLTRLSAEDGMGEGIHGGGVHVDEVVYDLSALDEPRGHRKYTQVDDTAQDVKGGRGKEERREKGVRGDGEKDDVCVCVLKSRLSRYAGILIGAFPLSQRCVAQ